MTIIVFCGSCLLSSRLSADPADFERDAAPTLRSSPALLDLIHKSLDVSPTGGEGTRGRSLGTGKPVGPWGSPFIFPAKVKGTSGPYILLLLVKRSDTGWPVIEIIQGQPPKEKAEAPKGHDTL
jgi:hypothetical protein